MKKGLLSLLAVALTIVSCQDYDDQFAELTGLVTTLSTKVAGIETTTANLAALSATVSGLSTAIAALPTTDSTADLTAVLAALVDAQADIDKIELALAAGVASADDLADIDALIDTVQAGVNTLLTSNQSINVNITISDSATLATAQSYIELGADKPAGYLLGGSLTVNFNGLTPAEITAANLLTAKLISVSAAVSVTGAVNLTGLTYIGGNYTKNGAIAPLDTTISSLGGSLSVDGKLGVISFPSLTAVGGNVTISNLASVTSIDFSNVTSITPVNSSINSGNITVASATTVDFGAFRMSNVVANSATSVNLGQTIAGGNLVIAAADALTINANAMTEVGGTLDISAVDATAINFNALTTITTELALTAANSMTVVHFDALTIAAIIDADAVEVKEFHIPSFITTVGTTYDIHAKTIAATKLKTISNGDSFDVSSGSFSAPAITAIAGTVSITAGSNGIQNFNAPLAAVAGTLSVAATSVTIASTAIATLANVLVGGITNLTLTSQAVTVAGAAGGLSDTALLSLSITGKPNAAGVVYPSFTQTVANFALLKYLNVADLTNVIVPPASVVGTMTTSGKITSLNVDNADLLSTLTIGHGPHTYTGAGAQTVILRDLAILKAVDLSTVTKAMIVTIGDVTGDANPVLASIIAPSTTTLESNGALAILIKFNSLVGTSTVVEVGSRYAEVISPSLTTWKNYIGLAVGLGIASNTASSSAYINGTGSISVDLDYDKNGAGTGAKYAAGWSSGTIDTPLEVASIDINQ